MNIAYLDSSEDDIIHFENICKNIVNILKCNSFTDVNELLCFLEHTDIDMVFIEACKNYIDYTNKIRQAVPGCSIVLVANTADFAINAFEIGLDGYILKPCQKEKILIPLNRFQQHSRYVRIKTFGNFDLFVNNTVVMFSNKKSKEMLALLTDKCGGSLNMEQIIDVLWEDRPYNESTKSLYRIALKDLRDTLKKHNCYHILIESKRQRSLDITKVSCDYFDYLNGKPGVQFSGEYMTNYSWGEYTLAKIMKSPFASP
ncbi:MAG: hypothetical protein IKJ68_08885 [Clostridia bacterium]|nr:hypothetical protein [Clostridia bacterium]